jgi:hypothetical protein
MTPLADDVATDLVSSFGDTILVELGVWAEFELGHLAAEAANDLISKLRKTISSVVSSQNALQTVVGVMSWPPYFRSTHNARYCQIVLGPS